MRPRPAWVLGDIRLLPLLSAAHKTGWFLNEPVGQFEGGAEKKCSVVY